MQGRRISTVQTCSCSDAVCKPCWDIEQPSPTDLKQAWGHLRTTQVYEPKMLQELCHVHAMPEVQVDDKVLEDIRSDLLSCATESALALHLKGRKISEVSNHGKSPEGSSGAVSAADTNFFLGISRSTCVKQYEQVSFHTVAFLNVGHFRINKFMWENLSPQEQQFYKIHVAVTADEAAAICHDTLLQKGGRRQRERKLRITASSCHAYFTFLPTEHRSWAGKVQLMYCESFPGNKATRHGKRCEGPALEKYTEMTGSSVRRFRLVVNPPVPWLGCSSDGVAEVNDVPSILVEVKSPEAGKNTSARELIAAKMDEYIIKEGENNHLRKKHSHYSQCQLECFC
ncbi:uncharacterized protein LOC120847544 isoform X1 [Ixodes scapularis]|uniref:uncharacterized protein LOC120847544 isoform X1 n=1 Tax=Ixodes scapularis TaxID=6945 RepID=UPI001C383AFB|nr:uncharacterized protein LOC120847544 isoform X1 [Ixodes scapularis]